MEKKKGGKRGAKERTENIECSFHLMFFFLFALQYLAAVANMANKIKFSTGNWVHLKLEFKHK